MSVADGLAELASATAWQRANGNADRPCQDCGDCAITMWSHTVTIWKQTIERVVCNRCKLRQIAEG